MLWNDLTTDEQLNQLVERSHQSPQVIFKYSSRCSISDVVRNRLEKKADLSDLDFHFLDLIRYRGLSNEIAERFKVRHESPQVLLIKDGKCIYDESHLSVTMEDIVKHTVAA